MSNNLRVGLIGFGTVGSGSAIIMREKQQLFFERYGINIELKKICDKSPVQRITDEGFSPEIYTNDVNALINNPEIDVIVELIGGIEPAKTFILRAIENGKHVVTANKALLAMHWDEIFSAAQRKNVMVGFEASVGGGAPVIKSIRESLVANNIQKIIGIMNGTTNYILTKMEEEAKDFSEVLKEAQRLGYAEADPTFDVEGVDTAHKLTILSSLGFGYNIKFSDIYKEGISGITLNDIHFAKELGYTIKLLAIGQNIDENGIELRVHPTLISCSHPLAQIKAAYNAFFIEGDRVGKIMLQGLGAGKYPTGSAVVADLLDIARFHGKNNSLNPVMNDAYKLKDIKDHTGRFYACFYVSDRPGVLATISGILGKRNISIASVIQKERSEKSNVPIVMLTHEAKEKDMCDAINEINALDIVFSNTKVIRIEDLTNWEN
jgi:homoserine dehydrogenase